MPDSAVAAGRILKSLPGVLAARRVDSEVVQRVAELESRYEQDAFLPIKNLGVLAACQREVAFALLKDKHFREPPQPTVYLVEEQVGAAESSDATPGDRRIEVEGRVYAVVGEEVLASRQPYAEKTVALGDSFVIFPERRKNPGIPSYFLVPPLGFPELETVQGELGIMDIVSISPSAQADDYLRRVCSFPSEAALATLLVAFNLRPSGSPSKT
jgi:hypothetical protein